MDAQFYVDTKPPFAPVIPSSVTLTTSLQVLVPTSALPLLPANYFGYVGKAIRVRHIGMLTTGTTPGAFTFTHRLGSGAAGAGTDLGGVAGNITASVTNQTWISDYVIRCRAIGTNGSLLSAGTWFVQGTGMFSLPPNSLAVTTGIDLTQAMYVSLQCSRSGSTAESIQVWDIMTEALN